mmetsp:Transcript_33999/g.97971  ORF Transcript_33999/g.97971 Transcript_33999/m.97971 type:complete len:194 (-) Transcript_33999:619-1200(-)
MIRIFSSHWWQNSNRSSSQAKSRPEMLCGTRELPEIIILLAWKTGTINRKCVSVTVIPFSVRIMFKRSFKGEKAERCRRYWKPASTLRAERPLLNSRHKVGCINMKFIMLIFFSQEQRNVEGGQHGSPCSFYCQRSIGHVEGTTTWQVSDGNRDQLGSIDSFWQFRSTGSTGTKKVTDDHIDDSPMLCVARIL